MIEDFKQVHDQVWVQVERQIWYRTKSQIGDRVWVHIWTNDWDNTHIYEQIWHAILDEND